MNNILTPKEWLEREGVFPYNHFTVRDDINDIPRTEDIMERYTNYRNKILESKILEFRAKLMKAVGEKAVAGYNFAKERNLIVESDTIYQSYINIAAEDLMIEEFDKHFGIEVKTAGKIN